VENPLLALASPPAFDRIQSEHVEPAIRALIESTLAKLDAIEADTGAPSYAATLGALERATEALETSMGVVEHLESTATTPALREAYNAVLPDVSALWAGISLRERLYQRLVAFSETAEARALDPTRTRFLEKTLAEFRRHGARLPAEGKARLRELDRELAQVASKFSQNVLDDTNAFELLLPDASRLAGLPASALDLLQEAAKEAGTRATGSRCRRRASRPSSPMPRIRPCARRSGAHSTIAPRAKATTTGRCSAACSSSGASGHDCSGSRISPIS